VNFSRAFAVPLGLLIGIGLCGCFGAASRPDSNPVAIPPIDVTPPPLPDSVPDAMPRIEKRSRNGNPPFYDVFGKRYFVLSSSVGYVERGVASWYGPGFHKVKTSTGESYDMYGMTAAHKTLPLPAFVRVTNLQNGRSVVVRVNDRGPFVGNRIIDLSYTAASKLDMLRNGTAMVEVRTIEPADTAAPVAAVSSLFIQAGAFSDPANAEHLAQRLRDGNYGKVFVRDDQIAGRRMYRVRIGPVPDVSSFDHIIAALEQAGINDAHLALD
jgi:rare lipoprotein A